MWSNTHSTRPGGAPSLLAARHSSKAFKPAVAKPQRSPEGQGDRNAIPLYRVPRKHVVLHFMPQMPVRATRILTSLGPGTGSGRSTTTR